MIDALLHIVDSDVIDLSARFTADGDIDTAVHTTVGDNAGGDTDNFRIRQTGLPHGAQMLVVREDTGTTTGASINIELQVSTNDSAYHAIAIVALPAEAGPVSYTAPIGLIDRYPEKETTENDHRFRVVAKTADGQLHAGTVDPTYSVYIVAGEKVRGHCD